MAKAATDEQIQLRRRARRRLIGAMALVTMIAVVLPWVLENEPRPGDQEVTIQIPSPDASTFNSRIAPGKGAEPGKGLPPDAMSARSDSKSVPSPPGDVLKSEQEKVLAPPAPKGAALKPSSGKDKPPAIALEAKKKIEPTPDAKQFVVQVTALADADKANGIQKELFEKGLTAYTERVTTASGEVTRVRVGPFSNRDAAEKERTRLKSLGFEGNVTPR